MDNKKKLLNTWESKRNFFNACQLKFMACIFMLISHISQTAYIDILGYPNLHKPMMLIGRISFPIFCFFIVQGIILTRDVRKYLLRLFIFALISEIPFDLAFYGKINPYSQNVFLTLFLGALLIYTLTYIEKIGVNRLLKVVISFSSLLFFMLISKLLFSDYSYKGIFAMFLLYLGRNKKSYTALALFIGFYFEAYLYKVVYGSIGFILLYNGKRGKMNKWFFYAFYPVHLLLIYFFMNYVTI
ncbi:MAG: TraX family protein [Peptoniphilaceae bacterium]|nr:TraX family protein [Peptoniphilaceae bacterium]MDY6019116.1 TraX family protein [Anaerococcus sp.]